MVKLTLDGGPRHGETHWYTEPLPDILCFQHHEPTGWVTDNYRHTNGTDYTYTPEP